MAETTLYDRLGGIFAIAAVVDHFSDALIKNPIVGQQSANPALREWHTNDLGRLPGLKFMRTLWVANVSGGPFEYTPTRPGSTTVGLEEAHRDLRISPAEFDEVAAELARTLDHVGVPAAEKEQVLACVRRPQGRGHGGLPPRRSLNPLPASARDHRAGRGPQRDAAMTDGCYQARTPGPGGQEGRDDAATRDERQANEVRQAIPRRHLGRARDAPERVRRPRGIRRTAQR